MAVAIGSVTVAMLGIAAQSASAATVSAPRATVSAPAAQINCAYTVTTNTVLVTEFGELPLLEGDILYGPKPTGESGYLYSYYWQLSGGVFMPDLHEEYCEG
jgi:hypothetical protein